MKKLLNPKWLILINTLPIIIVILLGWSEYNVIKSLLDEENISMWQKTAFALVALGIITLCYSLVSTIRNSKVNLYYCATTLIIYIAYLFFVYSDLDDLLPWQIPFWMTSGNIHIYLLAALMPTLAHAALCVVILLTPSVDDKKAWHNFAVAILIPISFYIFGTLIPHLFGGLFDFDYIYAIIFICGTLFFLMLLVRGIYILLMQRKTGPKSLLAVKVIIGIILPLTGLYVNEYIFPNTFGDFSSIWFYILALINGILLCIPSPQNGKSHFALFIGRAICYSFTFYFFIVFLPFLPLSLIAIIAFGTGFLMLTPLALFVVHTTQIFKDMKLLKLKINPMLLNIVCIISFYVLPVALTISYSFDKRTLNETLDYLYSPDYDKDYKLDKASIQRTLSNIEERRGQSILYTTTPYLGNFYRWLVLDNLNLSAEKKATIKNVFWGETPPVPIYKRSAAENLATDSQNNNIQRKDIYISDIKHTSTYDENQQVWISWIDLSLHNSTSNSWNTEYETKFELPEGCWISDYYLDVEGVRKKGLLADKKAATWIYNEIKSINKDPGILRYTYGNMIDFRVFPFQADETRYTGIKLMHKEPVNITIDNNQIDLGGENNGIDKIISNKHVAYIPPSEKVDLPLAKRKPYFHFIVNINDSNKNVLINQMEKLINSNFIEGENAKISYTGTYVQTANLDTDWQQQLKERTDEGGFVWGRALRKAIFDNYINPSHEYFPIFVVLGNNSTKSLLKENFDDFEFAYPDYQHFYTMSNDTLFANTLFGDLSHFRVNQIIETAYTRTFQFEDGYKAYLPDDPEPAIVLNPNPNEWDNDVKHKDWLTALNQQGSWLFQILYPHKAKNNWVELVKSSFRSGVMTPLTSYIVLENEAQEALLKKKQEDILAGNKNLDLEDEIRMSEPDLYILLLLLGALYMLIRIRRNKY